MADNDTAGASLQTFLIADVRGYTRFTQEHGDEAAARLAAKFARIAREQIAGFGGSVIELRGDEALAVFASARQALRAAVQLQEHFAEQTAVDPELPLKVGIGLDAGEAVAVEAGFRGGALNLAARLCSVAAAGEVLARDGVVHLAGKVDGIAFRDRGRMRLKGIAEPIRVVEVLPEAAAGRSALAPRVAARVRSARTGLGGRRGRIGVGAAALVVVAVVLFFVFQGSSAVNGLARVDADAAAAIDPSSGRITQQVPTGSSPGAVTFGAGSLWVANMLSGSVSRVDPATDTVQETIPLGGNPSGIAFGDGAVWVATPDARKLVRINPAGNTIVERVAVGNGPSAVTFGAGRVWVANRLDDSLSIVDPSSGRVRTLRSGATPNGIGYGFGSIWATNDSTGSVSRTDPRSGAIQTIAVGNGPNAVALGAGAAWVANSLDGTVSRIDPGRNVVVATIQVGRGPIGLTVEGDGVWVANSEDDTVSHIDSGSNRVATTVALGNSPQGITTTPRGIWVSVRAGAATHRGGTLRLFVDPNEIESIDPVLSFAGFPGPILSTNDGLVAFRRVSGVEGGTLVPDLARSLPAAADGGRSYTFQLRSGIRYSTGKLVRPSDFRRAIERNFELTAEGNGHFGGIVGASACANAKHCDLSRGIVADDAAGTVTFHLTAPDAEFLDKLALQGADAVPAGTPGRAVGTQPLPATGPYEIARYKPKHELVLVRNPQFRVWAPAAQPDGYPDRIVITLKADAGARLTAVERGKADWTDVVPPERLREVQTRYTAQVHVNAQFATRYFFLNTKVPPFDRLAARRAVNYAVDRAETLRLAPISALQAAPSCQVLPPNFPGYRPYCPYTLHPTKSGTWTAPDLVRARGLVRASGTAGAHVTVWFPTAPGFSLAAISRYFVRLLDRIGYQASSRTLPFDKFFTAVGDSRTRAQVGFVGWAADFPSPSDFFLPLLSCSSFTPNSPDNQNFSGFCDPAVDTQVKTALAELASDPASADELWTKIDREVVDQAPWVTVFNMRTLAFASRRVGNYQYNPLWGPLFAQFWVR